MPTLEQSVGIFSRDKFVLLEYSRTLSIRFFLAFESFLLSLFEYTS